MSAGETPVPLDELLAHREWVRRLALSIARDEHEADDVEQATWVAALRRPPTHRASLRGWLGTTVRHAASRLRRSERRRGHHEALAPARSDTDDAAELASRADAHRRVVEALVALEEPLRQTLLLRYFEGLSVGEVAARTGVPLETCRARLRRGRAKLRERLERELGGRDAFGAAVLLLAGREHGGGVASAAGGGTMAATGTKVAAAVAVAALAGAGLWWSRRDVPPPEETATAPRVEAVRSQPVDRAAAPRAEQPTQDSVPTAVVPTASPAAPSELQRTAKERLGSVRMNVSRTDMSILDALGKVSTATSVPIVVERAFVEAQKEACSTLHLKLEDVTAATCIALLCRLSAIEHTVEDARVVIRRAGAAEPAPSDLAPIPTVPRGADGKPVRLTILVVEENGVPVAGAEIGVAGSSSSVATTGTDGMATVENRLAPVKYVARKAGAVDSYVRVVEPSLPADEPVELRLRGRAARLRGTVRSAGGDAVAGAWVSWDAAAEYDGSKDPVTDRPAEVDSHRILTAEDGTFDDRSAHPGPGRLRVVGTGFAPLELALELFPGAATSQAVVLRPEAVCAGTVRTADGTPPRPVTIVASQPGETEGFAAARSKRNGTFRIGALPAGRVVLRVREVHVGPPPDPPLLAETTVELTEGATTTWDPVIDLPPR